MAQKFVDLILKENMELKTPEKGNVVDLTPGHHLPEAEEKKISDDDGMEIDGEWLDRMIHEMDGYDFLQISAFEEMELDFQRKMTLDSMYEARRDLMKQREEIRESLAYSKHMMSVCETSIKKLDKEITDLEYK